MFLKNTKQTYISKEQKSNVSTEYKQTNMFLTSKIKHVSKE